MSSDCPLSFFTRYILKPVCPLSKRLFRFIMGIEVEGVENIPKKGPYIIAANHRSYLDPPVIASVFPEPVFFVAKEELFKNKIASFFLRHLAAIPIKRGGMDKEALKKSMNILNAGCTLCIFPEGRRADKGKFERPKAGIGLLAVKSSAKILPVYIGGTDDAMPKDAKLPRLFNDIKVIIGKQMVYRKEDFEGGDPYKCIAEDIMDRIKELAINEKASVT